VECAGHYVAGLTLSRQRPDNAAAAACAEPSWYSLAFMSRALEVFDGIIVRILVAMLALAIIAATANLVWVFVTDL